MKTNIENKSFNSFISIKNIIIGKKYKVTN